jgi:peptidoglycan/xylan/chitin deacetylase (PgdA/CDA1 family)
MVLILFADVSSTAGRRDACAPRFINLDIIITIQKIGSENSILVARYQTAVSVLCVSLAIFLTASNVRTLPEKFSRAQSKSKTTSHTLLEQGAIIRGDETNKQLALVFTGDEFADGGNTITRTLKRRGIKASFFFTGRFYRNPKFSSLIRRLKSDGHYLGAHSDQHLLYCDWNKRDQLLVDREKFERDLKRNYAAMSAFGITKSQARFFLPPFEWYNQTISDWTAALDLQLINFTSGTRSNADYTTPQMNNYVDSKAILASIESYEARENAGLNGFILLSHIGVDPARTDKFYLHLEELLDFLSSKKYQPVRIDELLR